MINACMANLDNCTDAEIVFIIIMEIPIFHCPQILPIFQFIEVTITIVTAMDKILDRICIY